MLYSAGFWLFIILLLFFYYILPARGQWIVLLAGSYAFYLWNGRIYVIFLLFVTLLTYFAAGYLETIKGRKDLERKERTRRRKLLVALTVALLGGMLAVFKFRPVTERFSLLLPIGISYYTFQAIGYLVDVYRGKCPAEKKFFRYALFLGYFPAMIQGPINRFAEMKEQFFVKHSFSWSGFRDGAWLFLWGLFKKLVIADRCALYVSGVIGESMDASGSALLMGIVLFVVQMYGDFSGGIDMVEGISEMFGIRMSANFRQPFFSLTIGEFWRRWHISLGSWVRDYVFYSLAFSRTYRKVSQWIGKKSKHLGETVPGLFVSLLSFTIIGLWHEISLTYLLYGLWYGFMVGSENVLRPVYESLKRITGVKTDCLSYRIFCRARTWMIVLAGESLCVLPSLGAFAILIKKLFTDFRYYEWFFDVYRHGLDKLEFFILFLGILIWWGVSFLKERGHFLRKEIALQNIWFGWVLTVGLIVVIMIFGMYGPGFDAAAFIYEGI